MPLAFLAPAVVHARLGSGPMRLIDVRTPAEFRSLHAQGAESIPLERFDPVDLAGQIAQAPQPVCLLCASGARARVAGERLVAAGLTEVVVVEGGTAAWAAARLPVVTGSRRVIPLERQVRIAAGSLVVLGVLLAWLVHPACIALSAFVGAGLVVAGITDTCGLALVLARAPWNQARPEPDAGSPGT